MAEQMTNYQCPACTGPLHFNGSSGRLECEYCGNSYSAEEIEAFYAEKEKEAAEAFAQDRTDTAGGTSGGCGEKPGRTLMRKDTYGRNSLGYFPGCE